MRFLPIVTVRAGWVGLVTALLGGCASPLPPFDMSISRLTSGWYADYTAAEKEAARTGQPMLIYFKRAKPWTPDTTEDALKAPEVMERTSDWVRCTLIQSYEPDRRYVGQFGVDRAPAVIVVHPDGTYHAVTGEQEAAELARFLAEARPPGARPDPYPFLRRDVRYAWNGSLESAESEARRTGRSVVIVLDRPYTRDWERLSPMLHRREVFQRFADMIHCRPNALWKLRNTAGERFGVSELPAIVILGPDGDHEVLEMPMSYEAIVRFADRSLAGALADAHAAEPSASSDGS